MTEKIIKKDINYCINSVAPCKTLCVKKARQAPWYDSDLVRLRFKCDRMMSKYFINKNECNKSEFHKYRNRYRSMIRAKKSSYYKNFVNTVTVSSAKLWKKLTPFFQPNKTSSLTPLNFSNGNKNFNKKDMINMFFLIIFQKF